MRWCVACTESGASASSSSGRASPGRRPFVATVEERLAVGRRLPRLVVPRIRLAETGRVRHQPRRRSAMRASDSVTAIAARSCAGIHRGDETSSNPDALALDVLDASRAGARARARPRRGTRLRSQRRRVPTTHTVERHGRESGVRIALVIEDSLPKPPASSLEMRLSDGETFSAARCPRDAPSRLHLRTSSGQHDLVASRLTGAQHDHRAFFAALTTRARIGGKRPGSSTRMDVRIVTPSSISPAIGRSVRAPILGPARRERVHCDASSTGTVDAPRRRAAVGSAAPRARTGRRRAARGVRASPGSFPLVPLSTATRSRRSRTSGCQRDGDGVGADEPGDDRRSTHGLAAIEEALARAGTRPRAAHRRVRASPTY